jgi:Tol biopolymer transport system component
MMANEDGSEEKQLAIRKLPNYFEGMVAWSPNGKTIATAVVNSEAGVRYTSLVEVPVQGGAQRPLTQKRWYGVGDLATVQFEFSGDAWVAPMVALDSAKPITANGNAGGATWSPDGRIVRRRDGCSCQTTSPCTS